MINIPLIQTVTDGGKVVKLNTCAFHALSRGVSNAATSAKAKLSHINIDGGHIFPSLRLRERLRQWREQSL